MIKDEYIDLAAGYLRNELNADERMQFDKFAAEGKIDMAEVRELEKLYMAMGDISAPEPDPLLKDRFRAMLAKEMKTQRPGRIWNLNLFQWTGLHHPEIRWFAIAATVFFLGIIIGSIFTTRSQNGSQVDQLVTEVRDLREMVMISLLDNDSAPERLRAVNISREIYPAQSRVINALVMTLNNDPNVNVRLAAVDALVVHASNPIVRQELVSAISRQESPIVQVALADAMLDLHEPAAAPEFRKLIEQNDMDRYTRQKLEQTITALI